MIGANAAPSPDHRQRRHHPQDRDGFDPSRRNFQLTDSGLSSAQREELHASVDPSVDLVATLAKKSDPAIISHLETSLHDAMSPSAQPCGPPNPHDQIAGVWPVTTHSRIAEHPLSYRPTHRRAPSAGHMRPGNEWKNSAHRTLTPSCTTTLAAVSTSIPHCRRHQSSILKARDLPLRQRKQHSRGADAAQDLVGFGSLLLTLIDLTF